MFSCQFLINSWNWFFFTPESPVSLSVFRIFFGALLICNGLTMACHGKMFYGVNGVYPLSDCLERFGKQRFSLFHIMPRRDSTVFILFAIYFVASLFVMVGLLTNFSSLVVFLILISFHARNRYIVYGGDNVLKLMCFLLIFSNAGDMLSADSLLGWTGSKLAAGSIVAPPWCTRLMQIQLAIIYFRTVWWKASSEYWWNGTATYYVMNLQEFKRFGIPKAFNNIAFFRFATWATLVQEFALGTAVWIKEFQLPIVLGGMFMHLVFELFLNVELFSYVMLTCLVLFIPPENMLEFLRHLRLA